MLHEVRRNASFYATSVGKLRRVIGRAGRGYLTILFAPRCWRYQEGLSTANVKTPRLACVVIIWTLSLLIGPIILMRFYLGA